MPSQPAQADRPTAPRLVTNTGITQQTAVMTVPATPILRMATSYIGRCQSRAVAGYPASVDAAATASTDATAGSNRTVADLASKSTKNRLHAVHLLQRPPHRNGAKGADHVFDLELR